MIIGQRKIQLWARDRGYQVHLPAPQTLEYAQRLVAELPPNIAENLEIVTLEVVDVRPARDTDRCPPPDDVDAPDVGKAAE